MRLTVIGIGQTMRGDDAVGIEAVHRWQRLFPDTAARSGIEVQFAELPGLGLVDLIEGFDAAVLVDAVGSVDAAGQVYRLAPEELESFGTGGKTAHGWGVAETLQLDRQINPEHAVIRIRLIGIEAAQVDIGQPLSPAVEASLPAACKAIEEEIQALLASDHRPLNE